MIIDLPNEHASEQLAAAFCNYIYAPLTLTLSGPIGAGKTTFTRALLRQCGVIGAIKSPTFSLVETYQIADMMFHHFDLYRIHDENELDYIGFRDYFTPNAICCIEWPEHAPRQLERVDINMTFSMREQGRIVVLTGLTAAGEKIINNLVSVS